VDHLDEEDKRRIAHGVAPEDYANNLMISGGSGDDLSLLQLQRLAKGYESSPRIHIGPTMQGPIR
jgi:hypothetical protein